MGAESIMLDSELALSKRLSAAVVASVGPGRCILEMEGGTIIGRIAASCLLQPEPGDRVMVFRADADQCYVTAILERAGETAARLSLDGDVELHAGGRMRIHGERGLDFRSEGAMSCDVDELTISTRIGTLLFQSCRVVGRELLSSIASVRAVGNRIELMFDKLISYARTSLRVVEGLDQSRAGTADIQVRSGVNVQGRYLMLQGSQLTKLNGDQIHLG
jgi:hypothetical protein